MELRARTGYLIEEQGIRYLGEAYLDDAQTPRQAAACTDLIALGPRAGEKCSARKPCPADRPILRSQGSSTSTALNAHAARRCGPSAHGMGVRRSWRVQRTMIPSTQPITLSRRGVPDPTYSQEAEVKVGTRYLNDLMQHFAGRLDLVLAAHNAGENVVLRYSERIPPYRESRLDVQAVPSRYRAWRQPPRPVPARIECLPGTRSDLKNIATDQ